MKIALLLTGHMRSFRKTVEAPIMQELITNPDVDIFVETWNKEDTSDACCHRSN